MRHRAIAFSTGLGNPNPERISGECTNNKELDSLIIDMCKEAVELFFNRFGFCAAQYNNDSIEIGVTPVYQHDTLKIIKVNTRKELSSITTGYAFGYYGSEVVRTQKYYLDFKYKSKFIRFIDRWHEKFIKGGYLK